MHDQDNEVTGGVDTHAEVHVAAAIDSLGRVLGTEAFPTTSGGYRQLLAWLTGHGRLARVGIEGTGSYGAGLARYLAGAKVEVVEVNRANRQLRRRRGKSDTTDAEAAARAALNGEASGAPKAGDGPVESIRVLRLARRSAIKARTQAANQIRDLLVNAPDQLRSQLRGCSTEGRVATCARFRPGDVSAPGEATKTALRALARRHLDLSSEIDDLDEHLARLCAEANPALLAARGVGPEVAATLLVSAGDNPQRMCSESAFAALCGASPVEASSGKVIRHRLNTGGDRQANNALWRIVMVRLTCDERTKRYAAERRAEGKSAKEIIRCLKRYVAREVFGLLTDPPPVLQGSDLRAARTKAGASLAIVATALDSRPTRISELERGIRHDADLASRYAKWLAQPTVDLTGSHP
jgi:transposase